MDLPHTKLSDWQNLPELRGLIDLPNPPKQLFYRGTWDATLFSSCVAIVGSRRLSDYGRQVIEMIIPRFVMEKKTIISGFMYGTDQYAHEVCVGCGGRTIAILGWGISQSLGGKEKSLADSIIQSGGLLMSEWENQKATLWTFPVRNRIVAALSHDVVVIEAAEKSGSLITANLARKLKRTLWAVPGPITSKISVGTNTLISEGFAKMVLGDFPQQKSQTDDPLIKLLDTGALSANDIARKLKAPVSTIGAQLSLLTLSGQITERGGKYYARQN